MIILYQCLFKEMYYPLYTVRIYFFHKQLHVSHKVSHSSWKLYKYLYLGNEYLKLYEPKHHAFIIR